VVHGSKIFGKLHFPRESRGKNKNFKCLSCKENVYSQGKCVKRWVDKYQNEEFVLSLITWNREPLEKIIFT
jgi:hypothetical protein